jgi:predicted nucleic acid-binding protein
MTQATTIDVRDEEVESVVGDPEDDYVLATCRLGRADFLVTGDHGLLALGQHGATTVVTPRDFVRLVQPPEA